MPLELLRDLSVLEEMIVEVAKWRFIQDNPGRQRSPRGFTKDVELVLVGVESGSAVPVIHMRWRQDGRLFPDEHLAYFDQARDAIVSTIATAESSASLDDVGRELPSNALSYFDKIGRSLRDDEAIEFSRPNGLGPARLTRGSRRRLVLASRAPSVTEGIAVRGLVPEADQDDRTFELQLYDGKKIIAPISEPHSDAILQAFAGYTSGAKILVHGIGRMSRQGALERIESIEHVSLLDTLDVASQIDDLRLLQDGWLEGGGRSLSPDGLDWLSAIFDGYYPDELALPRIYPTEDGGVQAEWMLGKNDVSLEIDLDKRRGFWHQLDLETDSDLSDELDLSGDDGWRWVIARLRELNEGEA